MSKITEYLQATGTFFLATVDGDQPRLRPLGAYAEVDGLTYFGVGDYKDVYKQLVANPKCELVACKADGHWMRLTDVAKFDDDPQYAEAIFQFMPNLRDLYSPESGHIMKTFYIDPVAAVDIPVMGPGESLV